MKIEGRNGVREALLAGQNISKIYASNTCRDKVFAEIIELAKNKKVKIQFLSNEVLNGQSVTKKHQGLIAFCEDYNYFSVDDILNVAKTKNKKHFILILDGIEDPHNLGSILRVCDCMGVDGVVIGKNRACTVNETVVKSSAGASTYVKVAKVTNINQTIESLKKQNIWVYACELGGTDLTKSDLTGNIAIVIGSEGFGVSALTKKLCDGVVTIPMEGNVNSLNASVAAGMVVYEAKRQRDINK